MHWLSEGYVGLATVSGEECLVATALQVPFRRRANSWKMWPGIDTHSVVIQRSALPSSPLVLGTAGFPYRPRSVAYGNLLFLGDAAGFEEPFSGEGIAQALRSGMAAARAIPHCVDRVGAVAQTYFKGLRHHRRIRRRTRWLGSMLRSPLAPTLARLPLPVVAPLVERALRNIHLKAGAR
jgi:2-polyprenyl-6-methoxyphenol hydroxylase-like FAD-dependent oxidoreductase